MSQRLGVIFINAALGPVSYAGQCIMARRVKDGLSELSPDNLLGGVNRGIQTVAAATALPARYVENLLPMARLHGLAESIAKRQSEAARQWDIHTGHIGGLLEGVADLTIDGRPPDTSLCLLRLSRKMQMDKALAIPLRELSDDLDQWRHMVETCRVVIDDGESLRNAYLQKRILRVGFSIAALLGIAAAIVWYVRVDRARTRIDALLAGDDPCAVATASDSDLVKASSAQEAAIAERRESCETLLLQAKKEQEELASAEEAKKEAARKKEEAAVQCRELGKAFAGGAKSYAAIPVAKPHAALLTRIASATLTPDDLATKLTLPCPKADLAATAAPVFARFALINPGNWVNTHVVHPSVQKLIAQGQDAVTERDRLVFMNTVGGMAERTVLMGGEDAMKRVLALCDLLDALELPAKRQCGAARTAAKTPG
jgi:hypothetical protein